MKVRHYVNDQGEFCAEIKSSRRIFVNYEQINAIAATREMEGGVDFFLNLKRCPTPINQDNDIEDKLCDGIWFYDRLINFIDFGFDDVDCDIMRRALMTSDFKI